MNNISKILRNRDFKYDIAIWEEYVRGLPDSPEFALGARYSNIFDHLVSSFGGDVQVLNILIPNFVFFNNFILKPNRFQLFTKKLA